MSEKTNIAWTDHTGGPWLICSMVSAGCTNCYAMLLMLTRLGPLVRKAYKAAGFEDWETRPIWGEKATRVLSKGFWTDAKRINSQHAKAGTCGRWFPSMIDWLDEMPAGIIDQEGNKMDPVAVLADFLELIRTTPNLDWLLLTKRPEHWHDRIVACAINMPTENGTHWIDGWVWGTSIPSNIWLGVSVEDKPRKSRLDLIRSIPAAVRFVSFEPLLEDLQLTKQDLEGIDWGIVGGESGSGRRDCGPKALCDAARQLVAAGIPCFFKQDSAFKPGQKGRIPDEIWKLKDFPNVH